MNENYSLKDVDISKVKNTILNLLIKQLNNNINEQEIQFIKDAVRIYPNIINEIEFGPEKIFELIEKNTSLSLSILYQLSQIANYEKYLEIFIQRKWSINSLKVMNKLIQLVEFPNIFIKTYIQHCISQIKKETNQNSKNRMRILLSFFLCNLLENHHITFECIPSSIDEIFKENASYREILLLKEKIDQYRNKI